MKKIIYCLSALVVLAGCYKDKSTTSTKPISTITIEGLEEKYELISFRDALTLQPNVESTDPADTFEYLWTLYSNNRSVVIGSNEQFPIDTIGREKELNYDIELGPGEYTVVLCVTNARNGYSVYSTTKLSVNTPFTTGYYFLKETADGNTELDYLSAAGDKITNLLQAQTGSPLSGSPIRLGFFTDYSYRYDGEEDFTSGRALVPMADKDLRILLITDMSLIYDHSTMFYGDEPDEKPVMAFCDFFSRPHYVSSNGFYCSYQMPGMDEYGTGKYGMPIAPEGGCSFNPNAVVTGSYGMMYNFFDEKHGRFVYYSYNADLETMSSTNDIPIEGITDRILFMGTNGWAVFEDAQNPQQRRLYQLNLASGLNPITSIRDIDPTLNFNRAQVYGSNKSGATGMLYGGVGDKLYRYNTEDNSELLLTTTGIGSGEEITMITHKLAAPKNYLMIGTYKDGNYKVYMYETIAESGVPYGAPVTVASGQGRVVDMQYTNPSLSGTYDVNY